MVILYYFLVTIFALFTFLCENNQKKNVGMRINCEFYFDFNEVRQSMYVQNFFCIVFAKIIRDFGHKYEFLDDFS